MKLTDENYKFGKKIVDDTLHVDISDVISTFFLHYHNKYKGKNIKFIVDKNATIAYGEGKYIMIVEEGKGYQTILEMFYLEEQKIFNTHKIQ